MPETIEALTAAGVIVSLGHTEAPAEQVEAALAAGATGFTHLFNAMPPMEGRKPGPVGAALANRDCWAGLILDGIHVSPTSARAAFAAKTSRKLMLVSDAMATVGSKDPRMSLFGEKIEVKEGALRTAAGTLAGAHLDLSMAVRNAVSLLGATPNEALRMASLTPAEFLGVAFERGRIGTRLSRRLRAARRRAGSESDVDRRQPPALARRRSPPSPSAGFRRASQAAPRPRCDPRRGRAARRASRRPSASRSPPRRPQRRSRSR